MFDDKEREQFLASAVHYLLQTGQKEMALLLAGGTVSHAAAFEDTGPDYRVDICELDIRVPPQLHSQYKSNKDAKSILESAFKAVFPGNDIYHISVGTTLVEAETSWRRRFLEEAERITNQNHFNEKPHIFDKMRFDSPAEVAIAKALDRTGVIYFPNCLARVIFEGKRENRFPDFLICYNGKWGILEVDGKTYHTGNAAKDHERTRIFEEHGVDYVSHFDGMLCQREPDKVVKKFLDILGAKK